jgi:hypothetical protein
LPPFIFPVAQCGSCNGSHQGQAQGYVEDGEGEEQESGEAYRDDGDQLGVMQDIVEDQKQDSGGDDDDGAIESVSETEVMTEEEARGAKEKQKESEGA